MKRILIADNDFLSRCSLKAQVAGFSDEIEIFETDSGEEALELFRKQMPEVVFTDVVLNGMNGLVAARQMMDIAPETKIFVVTEYDYFSYAQEAISIGIKEYLLKPSPVEKIYRLLRKFMPDVQETENPEDRGEMVNEIRRLEEMSRQTRNESAGITVVSGAAESSFVNKLTLNDIVAAHKEGKQLIRGYFETTDNTETFRDTIIEFFVMLGRSAKNILGKSAKLSLAENIADIMDEPDKSIIMEKAILKMDTIMAEISENDVLMPNELRRRLQNYLNSNTAYNISLEDLSAALGVSSTYLSRKFKEWMGTSFSVYMTSRRMEYAKKLLLTTGDSVKSISAKVGYNDSNYFCRVFKKCMGQSPAYYRSLHLL